ncbi:MAG: bifunctional histidinol-phosphatase/imidazoleglycerol-phosphate dehydratase HisB [Bacteroidota bacterium]
MKKRIIFLDRDGTLIKEPPEDYQVDSLEKLSLLPGVIRNLYELQQQMDVVWVMITNQDGLGTESFPEETFWPAHDKMMELFEQEGITFDEVIIDKTFAHEKKPTRKPETGLVTHYMTGDYDLENSWVVGDRWSDIKLAQNLGAKGILIGKSLDPQDERGVTLQNVVQLQTDSWDEIATFLLSQKTDERVGKVHRKTYETDIHVQLSLDEKGTSSISTGVGFFDHMLEQVAKHAGITLNIQVEGDLHIDPHHTIEDTALALGQAFKQALGDKRGIQRYGFFLLPMDEALTQVALDFSGRPWLVWNGKIPREKVGAFPVEMTEHFFKSFCDTSGCTLNIQVEGTNAHHMIEATFKGFARAIKAAIVFMENRNEMPSTKGVL